MWVASSRIYIWCVGWRREERGKNGGEKVDLLRYVFLVFGPVYCMFVIIIVADIAVVLSCGLDGVRSWCSREICNADGRF